ncbi:MAG: ATP synthase subunit a [Phycisphaerae bacterium]|nr:ATP synthase subunit a [Phycisphaerae bacterium]
MLSAWILASGSPEDHVLPHKYFQLLPFNFNPFGWDSIPILNIHFGQKTSDFTNHLLMTLVAAGLCWLIFPWLARQYAGQRGTPQAPRGAQNLLEALLEFVRKGVAEPVLGPKTDAFMPYLWTTFFFILFCNLLGMIPLDAIFGLITAGTITHLGGTATGNLAVTAGLALCAFFTIHISGTREVYRNLVAGTYGHHGHEEHHDEAADGAGHGAEPHGHGHGAHGAAHAHAHAGMDATQAAVWALPNYLWNFAPHVFASHAPREVPASGLRLVMVPCYVALLGALLYYGFAIGLESIIGNAAGAVGLVVGIAFGLVAGFLAKGLGPGDLADTVMWAILLLLELLGAVIKPFALMIRLFANMVAGHIVLASILALAPLITGLAAFLMGLPAVLGCVALSCLELFVAFLQAYIFTFLSTLFIGMSVSPEH